MRILHIIDTFGMGGAETWLVRLVKYAEASGEAFPKFDFLVTSGLESIFDIEIKEMGCEIFYLPLKKGKALEFAREFRALLKKNNYAAIHDHQDFLSGWHYLFALGLMPKVRVTHVHNPHYQLRNNYGTTLARRTKLYLGRQLVKVYGTHITGTSGRILEEYQITKSSNAGQDISVLNCAFALENFKGGHSEEKLKLCKELNWPLDSTIVLFAGRLDYSLNIDNQNNHKNSAFAVNIISACKDSNVRMVMAGKNDFIINEFKQFIDDLGLSSRVVLLGVREDISHLMLAADVLLFPSRAEGMGMVAVEAQAAGLPVCASSAVPDEIVVIKELVEFVSLEKSYLEWVTVLNDLARRRRDFDTTADVRWQKSPFNIKVCWDRLKEIYSNGEVASNIRKEE